MIGASLMCVPTHADLMATLVAPGYLQTSGGEITLASFNCSGWEQLWGAVNSSLLSHLAADPDGFDCDAGYFLHYWDYLYFSIDAKRSFHLRARRCSAPPLGVDASGRIY